jgi:hypothetical protein
MGILCIAARFHFDAQSERERERERRSEENDFLAHLPKNTPGEGKSRKRFLHKYPRLRLPKGKKVSEL